MPPKKIKTPETGRFVLRDGEVGRRILAQQAGKAKQATTKQPGKGNKKRQPSSSEEDESEYEDSEFHSSMNETTDGESEGEATDETSGSEGLSGRQTRPMWRLDPRIANKDLFIRTQNSSFPFLVL